MIGTVLYIVVAEFCVAALYFSTTKPVHSIISEIGSYGVPSGLQSSILFAYNTALMLAMLAPLIYGIWYATKKEFDAYQEY